MYVKEDVLITQKYAVLNLEEQMFYSTNTRRLVAVEHCTVLVLVLILFVDAAAAVEFYLQMSCTVDADVPVFFLALTVIARVFNLTVPIDELAPAPNNI
mmetsp:Transcript_3438/g.8164  ORF Transcript_3438/g.8164 Transcript_3438/m.8164 type:complete len:99 (+) Transcript_3438:2079-2375(+)